MSLDSITLQSYVKDISLSHTVDPVGIFPQH